MHRATPPGSTIHYLCPYRDKVLSAFGPAALADFASASIINFTNAWGMDYMDMSVRRLKRSKLIICVLSNCSIFQAIVLLYLGCCLLARFTSAILWPLGGHFDYSQLFTFITPFFRGFLHSEICHIRARQSRSSYLLLLLCF